MEPRRLPTGIRVELPGRAAPALEVLVVDFTGTLSLDGRLLAGVGERLRRLADRLAIVVLTADTFGTARQALAGLPVEVRVVRTGREKADYVAAAGAARVVAIGNGRNDVEMLRAAGLGIAVIGPEGCFAELPSVSQVVVGDVLDALDTLLNPLRLTATLRE